MQIRPDPKFRDLPLADQRLWVAKQILASHRFPFGDGPGTKFNGAFEKATWKGADAQGDGIVLKIQGGPLALHRYIHFCVVFAEGGNEPIRLMCNRGGLLDGLGGVSVRRSVGHNPYWAGNAFHLWTPEHGDPARITWSFAIRALYDAASGIDDRPEELEQALAVVDAFGARHGAQLDQDVMGMPMASRSSERMLDGPQLDTTLGRALRTCIEHAQPHLQKHWDWMAPAVATLWTLHGRRIERLYQFSPEVDHDAIDEGMRMGQRLP